MHQLMILIQMVVALGLLNVWLLRFHSSTAYRGGNARSMPEEFAAYGMPRWSTYVIGALKVGAALALIAGLWFPALILPASVVIAVLMVGALAMHWKVKDAFQKYIPAFLMLVLSTSLGLMASHS